LLILSVSTLLTIWLTSLIEEITNFVGIDIFGNVAYSLVGFGPGGWNGCQYQK